MKFCSTRNSSLSVPLAEALFSPRPADGGIFMPRDEVDFRHYMYLMDETTPFEEIVRILFAEALKEDARPELIQALASAAEILKPRVVELDESVTLLELYNGPTAAFQDFPLTFLATLMAKLKPGNAKTRVLIPTAGDTGNAAAHAFSSLPGFEVVLLCPAASVRGVGSNHRISSGGNTRIVAVDADRAAVQALAMSAFASTDAVKAHGLVSATTLNPGRFISQIFHFIYGFTQLKKRGGDFLFDIPSGNYGNFTSAILAWKWGMPVNGFIAATYRDIAPETKKGKAKRKQTEKDGLAQENEGVPSFSDVVNPDHYERMIHLSAGNPAVLRSIIHSEIISEEEAGEAVKLAHGRYGAFLAPPTAVGYAAALDAKDEYLEDRGTIVLLGTSHPHKYSEAIKKVLGVAPPPPAETAAFAHDDPRVVLDAIPDATIPPDLSALRDILSIG